GATTVSDSGAYSVKHTIDRVETDIKLKGLMVFARVDHAAGAMEVGLSLAPTLLLIFGNPRGGDGSRATGLTYNDPHWIAERHGLGQDVDQTVKVLSGVMAAVAKQATT